MSPWRLCAANYDTRLISKHFCLDNETPLPSSPLTQRIKRSKRRLAVIKQGVVILLNLPFDEQTIVKRTAIADRRCEWAPFVFPIHFIAGGAAVKDGIAATSKTRDVLCPQTSNLSEESSQGIAIPLRYCDAFFTDTVVKKMVMKLSPSMVLEGYKEVVALAVRWVHLWQNNHWDPLLNVHLIIPSWRRGYSLPCIIWNLSSWVGK